MVLTSITKSIGFIRRANLLFNSSLEKSIKIIITKNLAIDINESLLIVYDSKKESLAIKFKEVASLLVDKVDSIKMPILKVNGQEPPINVANNILNYDAAIFITSKSISHTKARRDASAKGVRIASMPNVTIESIRRCIDIDYTELKKNARKVGSVLTKANSVRITTELGTDISFSIAGRQSHGLNSGIYDKKGKWGNLPEGEVFIAPIEGTTEGYFVVDGSIGNFGKVRHPLIFFVKNGFVEKIYNGNKPSKIEKLLDKVGKKARNIAEFGIGLNKRAIITGIVLEDEKVYGTCHIALGNNIGFGGKVDVPLHIDCVFTKPNIYLDNQLIIKKGKLLI